MNFDVSVPHARIHAANTALPNLSKNTENLLFFFHKSCKLFLCFTVQVQSNTSLPYKLFRGFQSLVMVGYVNCSCSHWKDQTSCGGWTPLQSHCLNFKARHLTLYRKKNIVSILSEKTPFHKRYAFYMLRKCIYFI